MTFKTCKVGTYDLEIIHSGPPAGTLDTASRIANNDRVKGRIESLLKPIQWMEDIKNKLPNIDKKIWRFSPDSPLGPLSIEALEAMQLLD